MITFSELVKHGFVAGHDQDRLQRYIQAKRRFLDTFDLPASELDGGVLERLRRAEHEADTLCLHLKGHVNFLRTQVLPPLTELELDRELFQGLMERISALSDCVPERCSNLPFATLFDRLQASMRLFDEVNKHLLEVRHRLTSP